MLILTIFLCKKIIDRQGYFFKIFRKKFDLFRTLNYH